MGIKGQVSRKAWSSGTKDEKAWRGAWLLRVLVNDSFSKKMKQYDSDGERGEGGTEGRGDLLYYWLASSRICYG